MNLTDGQIIGLVISGVGLVVAVALFLRGKSKIEDLREHISDEFKAVRREAVNDRHDFAGRIFAVIGDVSKDLKALRDHIDHLFDSRR